jgi:hypothetical protein
MLGLLSFVFAFKEDDPPGGDFSSLRQALSNVVTPSFA